MQYAVSLPSYADTIRNARRTRRGTIRKSDVPNGVVIYRGPSRIDGKPIVAIATGFARGSENEKTGRMIQTWILREDVNPWEALHTAADVSICGACPLRAKGIDAKTGKLVGRACYVNVAQAPNRIHHTYRAGRYPLAALEDLPGLFAGQFVRLGAYGDPAAVPIEVWDNVLARAAGHTGYTHQWKAPRLRDVLRYCQLSADSCEDADKADAMGVGYFRVLAPGEAPRAGEMVCPASAEAGKRMSCAECRACHGAGGARVVIAAHGMGASNVKTRGLPVLTPRRAAAAA